APVPTVTAPKATAAGTTDAGATGVRATDAATGFCVIPDQREINRPVVFIADDAMATVCFERGTHRYCGTVDLASGTWRTASEPRMPAPAFTTRISNDKRLFCRAGAACIPLELPVNDFDH